MSSVYSANMPYARALPTVFQPQSLQHYQPAMPVQSATAPSIWQTYRDLLKPPEPQHSPFQATIAGVRHSAEGAFTGALLGFLEAEFGTLDIKGKYPADAIAAAILLLFSIKDAGDPNVLSSDMRAISKSCSTVASYRMMKTWREKSKTSKSEVSMSGHSDGYTDPVVQAAQKLGFSSVTER